MFSSFETSSDTDSFRVLCFAQDCAKNIKSEEDLGKKKKGMKAKIHITENYTASVYSSF